MNALTPAQMRYRVKGTKLYVEAQPFGAGDTTGGQNYTAAAGGRRSKTWRVTGAGPNAAMTYAVPVMRDRSRDQVRNNPFADSAISTIETNVVGTGIKPQFATPDAGLNRELAELFFDWTDEADADGISDWYGAQALAMRGIAEGGEVFGRLRVRRPGDMDTVPLQIQVLEAEFVAYDPIVVDSQREVRQGIEFDALGKRMAYWMYRRHPGDLLPLFAFDDGLPHPVAASEVMHAYTPRRPGQIRGEPWLARALVKLRDLDIYDDAELQRKQTAALFAGFVTKAQPFGDEGFMGEGEADDRGASLAPMEPATLQLLEPGEDVTFSAPADVGANYEMFMVQQQRALAVSAGIMYEALTGDYSKINDRQFRAAALDFRRRARMWQHHLMVFRLCRPTVRRWLALAKLAEIIKPPVTMTDRQFNRVRWVPEGFQYINPLQEAQAQNLEVRAGFRSRDSVIEERGEDPEEVDRQIAAGNQRADAAGLVLDSDPRKVNDIGTTQPDVTAGPEDQASEAA